ncbi:Wzz/FepE/Etk N-terminal domain-containing protein [Pelotomaculum isophthalicicum JI]|uniref:Wzz/FepE/Etk N-terminal domain-containing protein n=1 Tax=Pelotomaculum isophthalicicum JI TaxID=947010 RepID=A0A9X4H4T3_9FIRM|nr:Wzz/FepE/Etk N-terminal domain-containing protein [Pelotomaculum isophthalicicum]MDF9407847.1 Wzz/FepE/Etk N-terminal domain-containing protein [Pelotomaculum isophthalicicum JI]
MKLKELGRILGELKLVLVLVPVVAMLTSAIINLFVLTPVYESTTTIIVLRDQMTPYSEININTITLNQRLVRTYSELAKSRSVAEEVINNNNLSYTPGELSAKIKVELAGDTEVLKITAGDSNPSIAALIANGVAQALSGKVYKVMNVKNIQVLDPAVPSGTPVSPKSVLNILVAGILGLVITVAIIFVREYLDDTIRYPEEIESLLKLSVLGMIPAATLQTGDGRGVKV